MMGELFQSKDNAPGLKNRPAVPLERAVRDGCIRNREKQLFLFPVVARVNLGYYLISRKTTLTIDCLSSFL